ncbi:putative TWO-COMPONENT SYSTEM SENSOR HISTIDINE KINASE/RESPONSE REGULATOR [Vibrio nigripulchritudo SFn27]|uniref:Putative TWO-COMPONENT SYSTEM SENSOR HISTIDINE KINASE/RESPONSE REGULATOR n=1 Tax=Vibrio nigripulchritudo TaxID=28173 RepID=U4KAE0_9VIBR|nr:response regulator [Vibrio nigripulchritudo]CCN83725.1 putative TWO-COMPONENT SYSTEM SENSOR HISTIDINE KINASE/RESPONSE REGULATOR [Vibrio nigripulchritudo BLFn1]CCN87269.1 putative TWO-COMPONENT SYSTEM SENSOR HISTIDINE KINASE/RESPONSE REGULATOR [Vibrio nigripulchritudo SFn27]CCN94648.1 putative TWO-COMPONENT SYSTEM SENSOR HISTIDINE KINASE/RESPONSE REGULATOR [Vibrio nigripulchritudo ENn2]CCO40811.1 putative TWO-COMPONENT SYSTEM SENSOR HISTIDINE KINASE/RESPONSE REGULATOR [Vibrio nigripulchritudo
MEKINIVCVDDQREVLSAVLQDLAPLEEWLTIEDCESAEEALELIEDLDAQGEHIALVISDHVMPGQSGVELLTEISQDRRFTHTKKVLLTGQATHQDTISAINQARIESYFEKPWGGKVLVECARRLVTEYIFDAGLEYESYQLQLDQQIVFSRLR